MDLVGSADVFGVYIFSSQILLKALRAYKVFRFFFAENVTPRKIFFETPDCDTPHIFDEKLLMIGNFLVKKIFWKKFFIEFFIGINSEIIYFRL